MSMHQPSDEARSPRPRCPLRGHDCYTAGFVSGFVDASHAEHCGRVCSSCAEPMDAAGWAVRRNALYHQRHRRAAIDIMTSTRRGAGSRRRSGASDAAERALVANAAAQSAVQMHDSVLRALQRCQLCRQTPFVHRTTPGSTALLGLFVRKWIPAPSWIRRSQMTISPIAMPNKWRDGRSARRMHL